SRGGRGTFPVAVGNRPARRKRHGSGSLLTMVYMTVRRCLLLVALLFIPACSSNDRWQLHGRWISTETSPSCAIRFDANGVVTILPASGEEIRGRYTLLAGDYVDIELNQAWSGSMRHREKVTLTGSILTLHDSDGNTLRFQRDNK